MIIFKKDVDKSVLCDGMTIPVAYRELMLKEIGVSLNIGDSIVINIIINGKEYNAKLKNIDFNREKYHRKEIIQIRYSKDSEIAKRLRNTFVLSNHIIGNGCKRIPEDKKEHIIVKSVGKENTLEFECIRRVENEKDFIYNLDYEEIEEIAKEHSNNSGQVREVNTTVYSRDPYIAEYAKRRANGKCQLCGCDAPFKNKKGEPYLEEHHVIWLSKGGEDTVDNVVALCPNCHRKMHILDDYKDIEKLKNTIKNKQ